MKALAAQRCIEIRRKIECTVERITETSFHMKLYSHEITVKEERIAMDRIYDISYYRKSREEDAIGFLYLHTNRGVQTYYVKDDPTQFIEAYRKLNELNRKK
ncbi:hypothetical protein LQV63_29295 [Paenibacillus profundus]|uniref:Uncharacterized protein n=1 Tax=Paenibacillus profundus TaxID=1173085 RepID=A0ABS8YUQ2_9BACL|nr:MULTISPECIES: hypothetical protein [Paenibacillus]MCE5173349.1 hypothetical protein [Paenibacillus profundus]